MSDKSPETNGANAAALRSLIEHAKTQVARQDKEILRAIRAEIRKKQDAYDLAAREQIRANHAESERDALAQGLYDVYVNLGEDTDGARNARELFGPLSATNEAGILAPVEPGKWVARLVAAYREEMEAEADALQARIDRVAKMANEDDARAWDGHQELIRRILKGENKS